MRLPFIFLLAALIAAPACAQDKPVSQLPSAASLAESDSLLASVGSPASTRLITLSNLVNALIELGIGTSLDTNAVQVILEAALADANTVQAQVIQGVDGYFDILEAGNVAVGRLIGFGSSLDFDSETGDLSISGNFDAGTVTAGAFVGDGGGLTGLDGDNIADGSIPTNAINRTQLNAAIDERIASETEDISETVGNRAVGARFEPAIWALGYDLLHPTSNGTNFVISLTNRVDNGTQRYAVLTNDMHIVTTDLIAGGSVWGRSLAAGSDRLLLWPTNMTVFATNGAAAVVSGTNYSFTIPEGRKAAWSFSADWPAAGYTNVNVSISLSK